MDATPLSLDMQTIMKTILPITIVILKTIMNSQLQVRTRLHRISREEQLAAGCSVQLLQQVICVCDDNHDYGDDGHVDVGDVVGDVDYGMAAGCNVQLL